MVQTEGYIFSEGLELIISFLPNFGMKNTLGKRSKTGSLNSFMWWHFSLNETLCVLKVNFSKNNTINLFFLMSCKHIDRQQPICQFFTCSLEQNQAVQHCTVGQSFTVFTQGSLMMMFSKSNQSMLLLRADRCGRCFFLVARNRH